MTSIVTNLVKLKNGLSYWKVELNSGKVITEDTLVFDLLRRARNIDWAFDIVGSGDIKHIKNLMLCTPVGDVCIPILESYTAFQLKRGTYLLIEGKVIQAQIIGRVDDKETGACTSSIWDALEQKLYTDHYTSVKDFTKWRENVANIGVISPEVTGFRLL